MKRRRGNVVLNTPVCLRPRLEDVCAEWRKGRGAKLASGVHLLGRASSGEVMGHESRPRVLKYLRLVRTLSLCIKMGLFIDFGRGRACTGANENNNATRGKRAHNSKDEPSRLRVSLKGGVSLPTNHSTYNNSCERQSGGIMGWLLKQVFPQSNHHSFTRCSPTNSHVCR